MICRLAPSTVLTLAALALPLAARGLAMEPEWPLTVIEGVTPEPLPMCYGQHTVGAAINTTPDLDRYSFQAAAGDKVSIRVDGQANQLDVTIEVYDLMGQLLGSASCDAQTFSSCSVGLNVNIVADGVHLIFISDAGINNAGAYVMSLERLPPDMAPPYLHDNITASGWVSPSTDSDFYAFQASAGSVMRFTVDGLSNAFDVALTVVDATGETVDSVSCAAPTFGSCSVSRNVTFLSDGSYYARITDSGADNTGGYQLNRTCLFGACPGSTWENIGMHLNGVMGSPRLSGAGDPTANGSLTLTLDRAAPETFSFLVFGLSQALAPFKGGTLVPDPLLIGPPAPTSADGMTIRSAALPANTPGGLDLVLQAWIMDSAGPHGWAASNGLIAHTY